jgi:putative thiamine transport system substrate-binding protein
MRSPLARLVLLLVLALAPAAALAAEPPAGFSDWSSVVQRAKGQTVYWRAWAGDQKVNDFIAWAAGVVRDRYAIQLRHVKEDDSAAAVTALLADRAAGRGAGGQTDLLWLNGEAFASLKAAGLLFGPITPLLPHFALVDTVGKPTTLVDFTVPTDGFESPWGMAQITFFYDPARGTRPPRSIPALLDWARANPGRFAYPAPPDFVGTTFLKQAAMELAGDPALLQQPVTDATFAAVTAPLWAYLDRLHPVLWRQGRAWPTGYPQLRQMMDDGEIDIAFAFNPAEAASAISQGLLPPTTRAYVFDGGTIANTHFVAIPFNATATEAALVVADFLLSPEAQARKADPAVWGDPTVLDVARLPAADQARFAAARQAAMPSFDDLRRVLPEPHPSWMVRIADEWRRRYAR